MNSENEGILKRILRAVGFATTSPQDYVDASTQLQAQFAFADTYEHYQAQQELADIQNKLAKRKLDHEMTVMGFAEELGVSARVLDQIRILQHTTKSDVRKIVAEGLVELRKLKAIGRIDIDKIAAAGGQDVRKLIVNGKFDLRKIKLTGEIDLQKIKEMGNLEIMKGEADLQREVKRARDLMQVDLEKAQKNADLDREARLTAREKSYELEKRLRQDNIKDQS